MCMGIIKKYGTLHQLKKKQPFLLDRNPQSDYFNITEFPETMGGGKNGFLIEGSPLLKSSTKLKIDIIDVEGNAIYFEPATSNGKTFYDGTSAVVSVWVYDDTPIGIGEITIMGELTDFIDERGIKRPIPIKWEDTYNVKWTRRFKVNSTLPNKEKVRFFKKPKVTIDEIVKQVYVKEIPSIIQTGSVDGFAGTPEEGQDLSTWTAGTFYKVKLDTDNPSQPGFSQSMDETIISIPSLGYNPRIKEVLTPTDLLVDIPFTSNGLVSNFQDAPYSVTFEAKEDQVLGETSLTGSFADIKITDLKTFTGDVARVKIFRKSRNELGDFQFIQETKLESAELLRNVTNTSDTIIEYGNLTSFNVANFFVSHSSTVSLDSDKLINSMFLASDGLIHTSESIDFVSGSEYTLSYKVRKKNFSDTDRLYFSISGSSTSQSIEVVSASEATDFGSNGYNQSKTINKNFVSVVSGSANFNIQADNPTGNQFHISKLSLKSAEQTSFSPDEFNTIIDIPRKGVAEQFDFKFEFYDVNNNFIPITVTATKNFTGGNTSEISKLTKFLNFESNKTAFRFTTGSFGSPENQSLGFKTQFNLLTGSVNYFSSAFDTEGNYIVPTTYTQSGAHIYPGALINTSINGGTLTIASFSGSRHNEQYGSGHAESTIVVGSITYTASMEGGEQEEFETIYRFEDGDSAAAIIATSNQSNFVYRASTLNPDPSSQTILINVSRKNLGGPTTPIEINSASIDASITATQPPLNNISDINGIKSLSIGVDAFPFETGSVTYSFTSSDDFNIDYSDSVTISPVKVFGGVSVTLTNENASFEATPVGTVASGDFAASSGSIQLKVGNEDITFDDENDGQTANNTFALIGVTGSACTPNVNNPAINEYGITAMSQDSASIELQIRYKDGSGDTTDFSKTVTYTKSKQATANIEIAATPGTQTIAADSKGSGSSSPDTITVTAVEGGVDRFTSIGTPTFTNGLNGSVSGATITFSTNASSMSADTGRVTIPVTFTDGDGVQNTKTTICSVTRVKSAAPVIVVAASPGSQTIKATSFGTGSINPQSITITAFEGSANAFTSMTASGSNGMTGSISSNIFTYSTTATNMGIGPDSANITFNVVHTDSEGTIGNSTVQSSVSRVRKGKSAFQIVLDPQTQTAVSSSSIAAPNTYKISITEGTNTYTYRHSESPATPYQFSVNGITNGSNQSTADGQFVLIRPTTPSDNLGISTTVLLNIMDGEGQTFNSLKTSHNVNVSGVGPAGAQGIEGAKGDPGIPGSSGTTAAGIVFVGLYTPTTQFVSSSQRIDIAEFTDTTAAVNFWIAQSSGSLGQPSPSSSDWGAFSEEFDSVATDILLAQDAYANRTINVGTSGSSKPVIALNSDHSNDNANPYIGISATSYAASEGMYMGYDGGTPKLSLKGGASDGFFTWDGSNLNIQGSINITGGATADTISQLNTATGSLSSDISTAGANAVTSGSNAASDAQTNATNAGQAAAANAAISASNANAVAAGAQTAAEDADAKATSAQTTANAANASSSTDPTTGKLTKPFTPTGDGLFLGPDNLGFYSSSDWRTYMSSSGDFELAGESGFLQWNAGSSSLLIHGRVSGSQIEGGTIVGSNINIPNATSPKFNVTEDGNMTSQDATISGSIKINDGQIGLWHAIESGSGGFLQNSGSTPTLILDPTTPQMSFMLNNGTALEEKLRIKPTNEWQTTSGANISINDLDGTLSALTVSGSLPTSSTTATSAVYGNYICETNTATTYTIAADGTYVVEVRQPNSMVLPEPTSVSAGSTDYPNYNPSFQGQTHPFGGTSSYRVYFVLDYYLEAEETTTGAITRVAVRQVIHRGSGTGAPYYEAQSGGMGGSLYWDYNNGYTTNASDGSYSGASNLLYKSITLTAGTYKFKYSARAGVGSGRRTNTDASGNQTYTYVTDQFAVTTYSNNGNTVNNFATVVIPTNIIELTSKGLQILNDSDTYIQLNRLATGFGSQPTLATFKGGRVVITGDNGSNSADLTANYGQFQTGSFNTISSFGYSNGSTSNGGIRATVYPYRDNAYDLGGSTSNRWDDVFASNGSIQTSDRNEKENISGSDLGLTFINDIEAVKYNFISGSRTHYGVIAQQVSESLASSSVHTDNFAGYIESHMYTSGGMEFDKKYILQQGWDLNDFTITHTGYGMRYTELISPMIKAMQELTLRIEELEKE